MSDTKMEIKIRDCRKEDAAEVARLFIMAWPVEDFLAMDPSLTEEILHEIIQGHVAASDTLYSYRNTVVAVSVTEEGEKVVGAINGYDGALYEDLKKPVLDEFMRRFPDSRSNFGNIKETESGEYYLDSIGVDPSMRSHGIGSKLFTAAIEKARSKGFNKVGLIVDIDKPKAEALYIRLGFRHVGYRDFFGHKMKHMQIEA